MRIRAALLLASALTGASTPTLAIPVLFGGANAPGANGAPLADAAPGQAITVTGPMLQLRLADGSTVIAPQGTQFAVSSDVPVSIALTAGSLRVNSASSPITVTRGGVAITTSGGVFSAFVQGPGLAGRVNQGTAQVTAGGQSRSFSNGGGYAAAVSGIQGTFTPPAAAAPVLVNQPAQSAPGGFSAADPRSASGAGATVVAAAQSSGFPISGAGTVIPPSNNSGGTGGTGTGGTGTGGTGTGGTGAGGTGTGGTGTGGMGTGGTGTGGTGTGGTGTGGTAGPTYGGAPAVTGTVALTGTPATGYHITYAGDKTGIDSRFNVTVTRGASGELNGYNASADEQPERNTNQSLDRATAGGISVERWSGGVTGGKYYTSSATARTSQQGLHLAYGLPAAAVPAQGLATYNLGAATKPTFGDGFTAPGEFTGTMGILFSSTAPKVGVDYTVTMPTDGAYRIQTGGAAAAPSYSLTAADLNQRRFYMNGVPVTGSGAACTGGNCEANIYGILSGANADSVGVSYDFGSRSLATDSEGRRRSITGAAAFTQGTFDPSQGGTITRPAVASGSLTAPLRGLPTLYGAFYVVPKQGITTQLDGTKVTVNAQGQVDSFTVNNEVYTRNNNVVAELFGTKYLQIGRWNGGTIKKAGNDYYTADGWQGMPYVIGIPTTRQQLPTTGIGTYALKAATSPMLTSGDTQPGSFTGSLGVDFSTVSSGSAKVGIDGLVTVNTVAAGPVTYNIGTPGGAANPSTSSVSYSGASLFGFYDVAKPASGDSVCGTTCSVAVTGVLSGPDGRDAGLGYRIGSGNTQVVGAAAFQRTDDPSLAHKDINIRGLLMSPGVLVVPGSYGVQNLVNNPLVTYTSDDKGVQAIKDTRNFEAGTAQVVDRGTGGGMTWSRWSNGTPSDAFASGTSPTLGANQGMHQIVGEPATNIPTTGKANYDLAGHTKPTSTDNSVAPGTLTGSMAVQFGSTSATTGIGLNLQVAIGGHTYNVATTGGTADPGQSQIKLFTDTFGSAYGRPAAIDVNAGGVACPAAACKADISGFLAGYGGASAGIGYTISQSGSPNNAGAVQGTAAFIKAP